MVPGALSLVPVAIKLYGVEALVTDWFIELLGASKLVGTVELVGKAGAKLPVRSLEDDGVGPT